MKQNKNEQYLIKMFNQLYNCHTNYKYCIKNVKKIEFKALSKNLKPKYIKIYFNE